VISWFQAFAFKWVNLHRYAWVSQFLEQHLTCIINLFRTELDHLEHGRYKFPFDLNPATGPRRGRYKLNLGDLQLESAWFC
jgi:hypothetical protein